MITSLGYKIFFMFGTINIVGMGIFALYVRSHILPIPSLMTPFPFPASFLKLEDVAWRTWMLYLARYLRRNVKPISRSTKNKVRFCSEPSHDRALITDDDLAKDHNESSISLHDEKV
jgi:hypothetical protein